MEGTFFLGLLIGLAISYFAAKEFEGIAAKKGFADQKYFWWTFLAAPFGMLMVIALPDRGNVQVTQTAPIAADDLPEL